MPAPDFVPTGAGLVVLTRDEALVHTLQLLGSQYQVLAASTESELATHLLAQSAGVAILDAGTVPTPIDRLAERLRAQFPELVLIVAGSVDDQSALATQITNGTVYRFLHKPVSEQRVRLFVEAAWRRHTEEHSGDEGSLAAAAVPARERAHTGTNILLVGAAVAAALGVAGGWFFLHRSNAQTGAVSTAPQTLPTQAPRDAVLEDLLKRAEAALANNALVSPPGAAAIDYYRQAQRRTPTDPRGTNGIEKVIDRLLSDAEAQLLAQHLDEAQRLTDQARAIKPDHVRVAFLMAQIGKERERAVLAQAREAAATGNIEQALSTLDGAGPRSTLITEARQELEQKKLADRVHEYITRANERMSSGQLVEPAQDNAGFYIESARALSPNDAEVKQTQRQFLERLITEAHKALTAGNEAQGQQWIQAASDAGVSATEIAALKQEAEHVRATERTDALTRLALLVNQRLAQGKVLDPTGDSAKYYLTQLVQADPAFPSTQTARASFAKRTLEEAKSALQREDYTGAQGWLSEAHEAGADQASISALSDQIKAAQTPSGSGASSAATELPPSQAGRTDTPGAAPAPKRPNDIAPAASLELTHYVPPQFPLAARQRALSGWVDVMFIVNTDGSVSDLSVVGAEPAGVFDQPATEAVRKWRYRPILRDGQPINQRARVRVRFALQQ
jgi:TonB family protein